MGVHGVAESEPGVGHRSRKTLNQLSLMLAESVANAVRHGAATTVHVTVTCRDSRLEIEVRDDGHGFAGSRPPPHRRSFGKRASEVAERSFARVGRPIARAYLGIRIRLAPRVVDMSHDQKVRLVIADDHPIVLEGIAKVLEAESDFECAQSARAARMHCARSASIGQMSPSWTSSCRT